MPEAAAMRSRPLRTLAVCADDFGQSPGVDAAIVRLAQAGRLNAISCIANSPGWPEAAGRLQELPAAVDVGLHLNLTDGRPLSSRLARRWSRLPSLMRLIAQAHLGLLPRVALRAELHAQLSAFIGAHGRPPDFIDGHQHVHHLPGVRELILEMAEHLQPLPAMRSTGRVLGPGFDFKRRVIEATGGRVLAAELAKRAIPHNPALLGTYDFAALDYRALMQRWLAELPAEGGLVFCHPGDADPDAPNRFDPIGAARGRERAYLGSDAFVDDLAQAGVVLGRAWRPVRGRSAQRA